MFDHSWPTTNLGELFTINTDGVAPNTSPGTEFHHHSLPAWDELGGPAVEKGSSIESNKTKVTKPCVLVSKLNPRKPRVSVVESVPDEEHHCASTEFVCLEPKSEEPLNFWGHLFSNKSFSENLDRIAIGSTNSHKRYSPKALLSQRIKLPPVPERRLIAHILDTLDTQIQKTEALIAKLEKVKEGLLHDLLTRGIDENGRLRPSPEQAPELYQESSLGLIPRDWALVSLGDCITSMDQGWSPACEDSPSADDEWGVLKTSSVTWEGYTASENKKLPENLSPLPRYEVFEGDVLITRAGPKSRVGVVCYVYGTPPNIMISDKLYRLRFLEGCVPEFFSLQLSHRSIQSQISRTVSGMADSQTNISQHTINSLIACLPQKHEQETICNSIRSISLWVGKEKSSLVELRTLKAGLMDDLLTGRVRVTPLLDQAQATTPA